ASHAPAAERAAASSSRTAIAPTPIDRIGTRRPGEFRDIGLHLAWKRTPTGVSCRSISDRGQNWTAVRFRYTTRRSDGGMDEKVCAWRGSYVAARVRRGGGAAD